MRYGEVRLLGVERWWGAMMRLQWSTGVLSWLLRKVDDGRNHAGDIDSRISTGVDGAFQYPIPSTVYDSIAHSACIIP